MATNHPHKARKRFGQNFLVDQGIIHNILSVIATKPTDHIVEIGPGLGALTKPLLTRCQQLDVIELDRDLIPALQILSANHSALAVHQADALTVDFNTLQTGRQPLRIVGNLPYNISTPLLFHLLSHIEIIDDISIMIQKEVADRILAHKGNKQYGRLSIMIQYQCQAMSLLAIPPSAFNPAPKVQSSFIRLIPHREKPHVANDLDTFAKIVTMAFKHRRKKLRNNLTDEIKAQLTAATFDLDLRPEQLSVADYVKLSNLVTL